MTQAEIDILQGLITGKLPCVYVCDQDEIEAMVSLAEIELVDFELAKGAMDGFYKVYLIP